MTTEICQLCESRFEQAKGHPHQIYCSRKCNLNSWRKNNPEMAKAGYERANKSKKGKLRYKRFRQSKKRKEWLKKYVRTEKYRKYQREWNRKNPKKVRTKLIRYRKSFKGKIKQFKENAHRRAYKHFIKFHWREAQKIINRDKVCVYCQSEGGTFDHIIPISKGGQTNYNNLVLCCFACNASKRNKDIYIWCKEKGIPIPQIITDLLKAQTEQSDLNQFNPPLRNLGFP